MNIKLEIHTCEPTLSTPYVNSLITCYHAIHEETSMFVINQNGPSGRFGRKTMNNFKINEEIYIFVPKSAVGSAVVR